MAIPSSPEKKSFPLMSPNSHRGERGSAPSTPNQHPYAIKTTSTAVLTRSNSSGYAASHQHLYIPTTSTPASKHRHSKSDLSHPSPRPLPIPPSLDSPTKDRKGHDYTSSDELSFPSLRNRADTLPSIPNPRLPSPVKVDELPSNPRVWTTSQLASYLITALRVRSGESLPLPLPVAKDIATFVKEARLNGRAFLRLNKQDLESMGINNLWTEALLNASRNLRQNVLKGRIWGFDTDEVAEISRIRPYRNYDNSSSSSIDETTELQDSTPHRAAELKGRVRGLVASLERSSSSGSGFSNHGSSTSEGDTLPGAWADDEAAFASGSEASDIEERMARALVKKRILHERPPPPEKLLSELQGNVEIASPETEPTVEELLTAGPLSSSWGAKAWEDMNIGETVKRISPDGEFEHANSPDDIFGFPQSQSHEDNSKKGSDKRNVEARKQIKDIFSRPLPSRPLPSPPKSGACSPLLTGPSVHIVTRVDRSIQADAELSDLAAVKVNNHASNEEFPDDTQRLQQALSLLEQYSKRIAELEEKVRSFEFADAEHGQIQYESRGIETDSIPASAPTLVPVPVHSMESRPTQTDGDLQTASSGSPTSEPKLALTVFDANASKGSPSSAQRSQHARSTVDDTEHLVSTRCDDGPEWRRLFDGGEWDPVENGLPSYVLMVGFGVCAVVLSTMLKRLAGKKS